MADVVKNNVARKIGVNFIKPNELLRGMARHPEICCIFITFMITFIIKYGTSFKSKPVTLPPKQPQYMFPPTSYVLDSPRGSLMPLIEVLNSQEFVFVMYYAPWCYKSKAARSEFLKAANYFKGQVAFASVNCWWPEGDCRKRYKFLMFPVFMAYHTKLDGYRYFGHVRAEHMIQFLEDLIYPLKLLNSKDEILELVAKHENAIVGYFNLTSLKDVGVYRQFYYASMRIQERDPFQPIKFGVISQESVAREVNLTQWNEIVFLRLTNDSLFYPYPNNITSLNIVQWALGNKGQELIKRLSPEGLKSEVLATEMHKGPAFLLFHAESPLLKIEPGLRVLKDVVLQYRECQLHPYFRNIQTHWSTATLKNLQYHRALSTFCQQLKQVNRMQELDLSCCVSTILYNSSQSQNVCNVCQYSSAKRKCQVLPPHLLSHVFASHQSDSDCRSFNVNYSWLDRLSFCCSKRDGAHQTAHYMPQPRTEKLRLNISSSDQRVHFYKEDEGLDRSARHTLDGYVRNHLESLPRRLCDRLSLERHVDDSAGVSETLASELSSTEVQLRLKHLSHIGCSSNKTVNFYAIDSRNRWMFPDALGIEPNMSSGGPTAVLFDRKSEEHYIFKDNFTYSNTVSFLMDYEQGYLKRHQQSNGFPQSVCEVKGQVCLQELTSATFLSAVKEEEKDVVVLIYAHWCGFCQTLSHTFLALAQYFSTSPHIVFARINGATNDLPWEYTFDSYPVIVFFSARQKADSIVYPSDEDMSLTKLIRFVLHHATYDTKVRLAADVCSTACIQANIAHSSQVLEMLRLRQASLQSQLSMRETDGLKAESDGVLDAGAVDIPNGGEDDGPHAGVGHETGADGDHNASAANGQNAGAVDGQNRATVDGSNAEASNGQNAGAADGQNRATVNGSNAEASNGQNAGAADGQSTDRIYSQNTANAYSKLDTDYLISELQRTTNQIEAVERLKLFLEKQTEVINKEDLVKILSFDFPSA
ncbi:thioredoxin domain-containing protein 11-like isoform X3 [Biomphalaria glabrata]|uniref:Thioredoxin domain-containing protein 11-like isoform X3 n=1 Tax=Biomphalaria glabrata TaxID=6526 RepID=A0A9W2ZIH9_BIOGL|nr:thioredoxin domain-containing protein 11-like isoform X3 [Biomphalaria glabrata]KAI8794915.1 thioredoxin domain-containing protein 11 isoform X1 [Biomphalaria glabrata]